MDLGRVVSKRFDLLVTYDNYYNGKLRELIRIKSKFGKNITMSLACNFETIMHILIETPSKDKYRMTHLTVDGSSLEPTPPSYPYSPSYTSNGDYYDGGIGFLSLANIVSSDIILYATPLKWRDFMEGVTGTQDQSLEFTQTVHLQYCYNSIGMGNNN